MVLYLLVFVATVLVLYKFLCNGNSGKFMELADKIPGSNTIPYFGNSLEIRKKGNFTYFNENVKKYGTVCKFFIGNTLCVILADPKDVEILLKDTQNITKSSSYDYVIPWLGKGLITSSGEHWHKHRKLLTPAFHFSILEKFLNIFLEKGKILIKQLEPKARTGEVFDVFPYITAFTLEAIVETSMGQKINPQDGGKENEYVIALNRVERLINKRVFSPIFRNSTFFYLSKYGKEQKENIEYINNYCLNLMKHRREAINFGAAAESNKRDEVGMKNRTAFLDLLLAGQETGNGLTDTDILDEVNTILFAGHDTTSTAITFALYILGLNQEVQQKLYEEITDLFEDSLQEISMKDLQQTKYLDMVVKESLRMFPPVSVYSRLLQQDLQLTEYVIPAGASVNVHCHSLHRNKEHFPEPEKFDPERFSTENSKKRHPYAFVPFSAGPRNCIGQKYAMAQIKITLIEVLQKYKVLPGKDVKKLATYLILTSVDGVQIRLERRK